VLAAFGLPMLGRDYHGHLPHIETPYGHTPLRGLKKRPEFAYYKFSFVRNPWDRLVSAFFYLDAGGCNAFDAAFREEHLARYGGDFRAFVLDLERHIHSQHFRPQTHWLCDAGGAVLSDFVARYETIDADFAIIAARLDLPPSLPKLNASSHLPYREHYDRDTREAVARAYRQDIETFAYEY
ncbi:MAG TPA: sulfotransferase family 2 domain-containing protein, partial [Rhizomicrobium sp.]